MKTIIKQLYRNIIGLFVLSFLLINTGNLLSQDNSFVYLEDGELKHKCETFYPIAMNYMMTFIQDANGDFYITPPKETCGASSGCPPGSYFTCGNNPDDWQLAVKNQLIEIKQKGFNSIRLIGGLSMKYYNNGSVDYVATHFRYSIQEAPGSDCYTTGDHIECIEPNFEMLGDMLQQFIDVVKDSETDLKIIVLTGGGGIEEGSEAYSAYLSYIAERFRNEPQILGYDLYNEPSHFQYASGFALKEDRAWLVKSWYDAIKLKAPSHLVTIGTHARDVFSWDSEILPVDFFSLHIYPRRLASEDWGLDEPSSFKIYKAYLRYMSEAHNALWIIGETGFAGTDKINEPNSIIHIGVGDELEQQMFARHSLQYTKWFNAKGYSWWWYKDMYWYNDASVQAIENYFGLVNHYSMNSTDKLATSEFINFNPNEPCSTCVNVPNPEYYNMNGYTHDLLNGLVTNGSDPISNAYVEAIITYEVGGTGTKETKWYGFTTFTNNSGQFNIYGNDSNHKVVKIQLSYVGHEYFSTGWTGGLPQNYGTIPLSQIESNLLPPVPGSPQKHYTITQGEDITWDYAVGWSIGSITIEEGATLTLKAPVYFAEDAKIIVERGGQLIIDGGTLTSACNGLWGGIEVWGNTDEPQTLTEQGSVKIINSGTIENAICGIKTIKVKQGLELPNYAGGIIWANNAVFKNNKTAVKFYDYSNTSISYFTDCSFITDDNMPTGEQPDDFVKISGMHGIYFTNCTFKNNSSNNYYGNGIYSLNSGFKVVGKCLSGLEPCEDWDYGLFKNLQYGIYATSAGSVYFPQISHSDFTENYRGLYFSAIDNASVQYCNFTTGPIASDASYGIYLDASTGYTIEENNFYQGVPKGIGLVVNSSGPDQNIIYRNNFEGLFYGIVAQNSNRAIDGTGLVLKCNEYIENGHDQLVLFDGPVMNKTIGIAENQGTNLNQPDAPAGNRFSWTGPTLEDLTDIYNKANKITYYYHVDELEPLEPIYYTSETVFPKSVPNAPWLLEQSCPPSEGGGGGSGDTEGLLSLIVSSGNKADSVQSIINILKDGGNTEEMKTEVALSTPPETYSIYSDLMNNSPYISDTVMEAAIEKEEVLPNVMIRDVMVANPHNAKDDALMEKIDERSDPMPDYMKAQILLGGSLVSVYEDLQSNLAFYRQQRTLAFNALVKHYLTDTINPISSTDSLMLLLENENSLSTKYRLAFLHLQQGADSLGQSILSNIPQQFNLSDEELDVFQQLQSFYDLMVNLAQQGKTFAGADSIQIDALYDIEAQQAGIVSVYARNILLALGEISYDEPILTPDFLKSSATAQEYDELMKALDDHHYMKIFPNPAGKYIIIEHNLETEPKNAYVEIHNTKGEIVKNIKLTGKQNQQTLDVNKLKTGVYIATLYVNSKEVESVKFTKMK